LDQLLQQRNLPDIMKMEDGAQVTTREQWEIRRRQILDILCREEYGFPPEAPLELTAEIIGREENFCAGKVTLTRIMLKTRLNQGEFSFPLYCALPKGVQNAPAFIHINFRDCVPDRYMPTEEICDHGFAVLSFSYQDVCPDIDDGFAAGLSAVLYRDGKRRAADAGKIAMWAWAASRVLDYALTLEGIDRDNIAVVGHSRLGKTALLTGALDTRFSCVISNDSGCCGAALSRGKTGMHLADMRYPYWYCESYPGYANREDELPFDQHFLLSLIAPRRLYVASAWEDSWADPLSEFLSCVAADEVYRFLGIKGFIYPDRLPAPGDIFHEGAIGYHVRPGTHYLSRYDWQRFMDYMKKTNIQGFAGGNP